jgi:hypothetical protein
MSQLTTIDLDSLEAVIGGAGNSAAQVAGKAARVGGKLSWPVTAGMAAYDGYQGYSAAREKGASVGKSVMAGAQNAASGATFGLVPAPE